MIDRKTVQKLINDRGTEVTFRRVTPGAYDPATGTTASGSTADETVNVVFLEYRESEVDGSNIQRGDRKVIMSNFDTSGNVLSKQPQTDDQFVGEQDTVSVINARTYKDAGVIIGFGCQVRE